jgi:hypothetical protein
MGDNRISLNTAQKFGFLYLKDYNKSDPLDVRHVVEIKLFGAGWTISWAWHWSSAVAGTYPNWRWENIGPWVHVRRVR